ncbi:MAG: HpcH/HpaI aldolase/citrate lyase family protein [Helicobacteraceae bacterium]|nr:HpcH/HpaI aldolase/citrate lyase family protein [Candidatus Sulfurimonas ponti]
MGLCIFEHNGDHICNYIKLGGTLFISATHKNLDAVVSGDKYKNLKSVLIDTEDSIADAALNLSLENIKNLLKNLKKTDIFTFIRPRNTKVLEELLGCKNIDKIDGFILPKFSLTNADTYLNILKNTEHFIMPSIEGSELFEASKLLELREKLLSCKDRILVIRFGLEDMLAQLKMKRKCDESIFDYAVSATVLGNFIGIFKSAGFEISGGVYPCFRDEEGFVKDVLRDLKEGLFSKTIIHPSQIDALNELYKVTEKEYNEALSIEKMEGEIASFKSVMLERKTMTPFAKEILQRAEVYGIKEENH